MTTKQHTDRVQKHAKQEQINKTMLATGPVEYNIIYLWALRILIACGGHRKFVEKKCFSSDEVVAILGLEKYVERDVKHAAAIKRLKQMHADAEQHTFSYPSVLEDNLSHLLERIALSRVETD
ncbi:MAG: hypothetical protein Q9M08_08120, partial [Mariprofundus sp.]|nr:hypothetical protein [Mariprofundus sp.]